MPLGKGSVYSTLTRHKINTKILTESELVVLNNTMHMIVWTR